VCPGGPGNCCPSYPGLTHPLSTPRDRRDAGAKGRKPKLKMSLDAFKIVPSGVLGAAGGGSSRQGWRGGGGDEVRGARTSLRAAAAPSVLGLEQQWAARERPRRILSHAAVPSAQRAALPPWRPEGSLIPSRDRPWLALQSPRLNSIRPPHHHLG
jgi:hypothetical protein